MANSTAMVTSVSAIAISGEVMAMVVERSARRSRAKCMTDLLAACLGSAHQKSERFAGRLRRIDRRRQVPVEYHGDAVGDLLELVEVLADHENRRAAAGEIDQRLADHRR